MLVVLAGVVLAVMLSLAAPLRSDAVSARRTQAIVVGGNDTIWDLARAHAPAGQDILSYVAEVIEMNDVDATALQPGMVLHLPTR
ncbi:MAG: LysM peptidoglycan-binding domain-containing protein [Egibacteraceae bacterium]